MKRFNALAGEWYIMYDEGEREALAVAGKALSKEVGTTAIEFLSVEPVVWPDASMGWAEPGRLYAQMLTEGYRITARSAGRLFECRVSGDHARCMILKG